VEITPRCAPGPTHLHSARHAPSSSVVAHGRASDRWVTPSCRAPPPLCPPPAGCPARHLQLVRPPSISPSRTRRPRTRTPRSSSGGSDVAGMGHRKASPDGLQLACRGPGAGHAPGKGPKVVDGTGAGVVAAPAVVALGGLGRCGSLLARADLVRWLRHHRRRCRGRARDEVVEGVTTAPEPKRRTRNCLR
jgi:hypothetical protein